MLGKSFKALALGISVTMAASMIAGCGTAKNASEAAATPNAQTKQEPVKIEWLAYNTYGQPNPEAEVIKQQEELYNIKFNFWYVDDQQWDQVLGVKLAAGEMPDVLKIKTTSTVPKYVSQGVLAPITEDMQKKIPKIFQNIKENGGTDQMVDAMVDGKLYVIKNVLAGNIYPTTLTWRTDWLKNVGISKMPETIKEWEDAMYKFRNDDPDKNGKKDTYGMSNTAISTIFGAYGAIPLKEFRGKGTQNLFWTKKNDKYVFAATQPEMKDALALLQKWYKDGIIDPEFVTGENTSGNWALSQAFDNGKIGVTGMVMATHWMPSLAQGMNPGACYTDFTKINPNAKFGETFDIGKAPVGPNGKSGTHCWGPIQTSGVAFTTKLAKDPKKVDAVLNMFNIMSTDFDKWAYAYYGQKDKDYTIDPASGQYMADKKYATSGEAQKEGISVLNYFEFPDFRKKTSPLQFQFSDKYNGKGYTDYLVPQTDAALKYTEDLKKFTLETYINIITGEKPVSYFDEFVKSFNEKGGAEIEKQTNEAVTKALKK